MPETELYPQFVGDSIKILRNIWDRIGYDVLTNLQEQRETDTLTGEDLRWIVPDFIDPMDNWEWYNSWKLLTKKQKEHILYIAFPKDKTYGF